MKQHGNIVKFSIYCIISCISTLIYTNTYAYSLKTVYEDAANSDPASYFFALSLVLLSYPIMLIACRLKLDKPSDYSQKQYLRACLRISSKQLLPLLFLVYVVAFFIILIDSVLFALFTNLLTATNIEIYFFKSINSLYIILWITYICWFIYSIYLAIKWLPKTIDDEMII